MKRETTKSFPAKFAIFALCLLGMSLAADAQTRRPVRKTSKPVVSTTSSLPAATKSEIKAGAEKVSTQIKNVTKFIYVLGGIARSIEDVDKEAKGGRLSRAVLDQNAQYKQSVNQSLRNLQAGLAALEIEFRTKPALRNYLFQIQGIADMTSQAEDQAAGGQLTASGKTLLLVVEKLSDTLVAMP